LKTIERVQGVFHLNNFLGGNQNGALTVLFFTIVILVMVDRNVK
jgi:hypothetical protein